MGNRIAANVLGTAGAVCWSVQLIPQIVINYRRHDTTGLQPTMMLLWACAGVPLGVYNIVENFNVALRIQPQILTFLSLLTWAQCKYYSNKWPWHKIAAIGVPVAVTMGGVECGLILGLRQARKAGTQWPITVMAILSACLLCAGVLRHYWDIYRERTVRGISFIFVAIDALGDLVSLISVFFEPKLEVLGMVIYGSELLLWCGVMACGGYYNLRPWLRFKISDWISRKHNRSADTIANDFPSQAGEARSSSTVFRTASVDSHGSGRERSAMTGVRLRPIQDATD